MAIRETRSLRQTLILKLLPVQAFSLIALACLAIVLPYVGAKIGGFGWMNGASKAIADQFSRDAEADYFKVRALVAEGEPHHDAHRLENSQLFVERHRDGTVWQLASPDGPKLNPVELKEVIQAEQSGFYPIGHRIMRIEPFKHRGDAYFLVRVLDEKLAEHVSRHTGSEVTFYRAGQPYAATWRAQDGRTVLPEGLSGEALTDAMSMSPNQVRVILVDIKIPGYRGLKNFGSDTFERGSTYFEAYRSLFPIIGVRGGILGFVSLSAPTSVLLNGPKLAMIASAFFMLLLGALSFWHLRRVAQKLIDPIAVASARTRELTHDIVAKVPAEFQGESPKEEAGSEIRELQELESSVLELERELHALDRFNARVEEERLRALTSAKLAAVGEMASGIAHEINNPLAIVHGWAEEIAERASKHSSSKEELDAAWLQQAAQVLVNASARVATIVQGLMRFSRPEDPGTGLLEVKVSEVIQDTFALCQEKMRSKQIRLSVVGSPPDALKSSVACRPVPLSQVLLNLLNNARDAVEGQSVKEIEVAVEERGDGVVISVSDSGPGVPAAIRDRIMTPFFTTKPAGKGTGLGLSVSKGILETMGGRLELCDQSPKTRFMIFLAKTGAKPGARPARDAA